MNSPLGQICLPTEGGQSSLLIAPGAGLLRSYEPLTVLDEVPKLRELESKEIVRDRSESKNQVCIAQDHTKIR